MTTTETPLPRTQDDIAARHLAYGLRAAAGSSERRHLLLRQFLDHGHAQAAHGLDEPPEPGIFPEQAPGMADALAAVDAHITAVVNAAAELKQQEEALAEALWLTGNSELADNLLTDGISTADQPALARLVAFHRAIGRDLPTSVITGDVDPDLARAAAAVDGEEGA